MGEQAAPAGRQPGELRVVQAGWRVGQQLGSSAGDEGGGVVNGGEQREHLTRRVARSERVDGELQQRGAGYAVAVGAALVDEPDGEQVVESLGHECRQQTNQLVERRRRARYVEVHQLIGGQPEDVGELVAVAPGREQVADAG